MCWFYLYIWRNAALGLLDWSRFHLGIWNSNILLDKKFRLLTLCKKNYWFADVLICMQNELRILKITDVVVYIWLLRIIAIFLSNGPSIFFFLFLFGFMKYRSSIRRDLGCIWLIWLPKIWFWSRLNCLLHMLVLERAYYVKFCEVINLAFDTMTEKKKH